MHILRTITRHLASYGFRLSVLFFALVCTLLTVFGSPQAIKNSLNTSGAYDRLADTVLDQATKDAKDKSNNTGDTGNNANVIDQPEVKAAAKDALTPSFIKSSTEQVVDGTYSWLDGKTDKPDFNVNLQPALDTFKTKAADAGVARLQKLPPCTAAQLRTLAQSQGSNVSSTDLFNAPCLPPRINLPAARQNFIDSFTNKNDFLKNPTLTADRLSKDNNGKTVFEKAKVVPDIYHWVKLGPWIFGSLAVLLAVAVLFLNITRRQGIRSLAASILGNGILLLVIGFIAKLVFSHVLNPDATGGGPLHLANSGPQRLGVDVATVFSKGITKSLLVFGGVYVVVGIVTLIVLHFTRPTDDDKLRTILDDDEPTRKPSLDDGRSDKDERNEDNKEATNTQRPGKSFDMLAKPVPAKKPEIRARQIKIK